ncbi:MAG: twin-arginine translocase TatA/TatE family subunit [Eubacteriaceae bacterium]
MLGRFGPTELLIILVIALLIFGPKQLPKLGKTFGKTIKSFKDGVEDDDIKDTSISNEES